MTQARHGFPEWISVTAGECNTAFRTCHIEAWKSLNDQGRSASPGMDFARLRLSSEVIKKEFLVRTKVFCHICIVPVRCDILAAICQKNNMKSCILGTWNFPEEGKLPVGSCLDTQLSDGVRRRPQSCLTTHMAVICKKGM